jgi:hypothetical protein
MDLVKDQEREGFAGVFVDIGEKREVGRFSIFLLVWAALAMSMLLPLARA